MVCFFFISDYCPPVAHLTFDGVQGEMLRDDSGSNNNAVLTNGALIMKGAGKCKNAALLNSK